MGKNITWNNIYKNKIHGYCCCKIKISNNNNKRNALDYLKKFFEKREYCGQIIYKFDWSNSSCEHFRAIVIKMKIL